jgi:vesicle-fusing ATPase
MQILVKNTSRSVLLHGPAGSRRILDWVPIGPRFSNAVLQTLLVLFKKPPPKGNKLLILCTTTNRAVLEQMDMADVFNAELYVGNITSLDVVARVVRDLGVFSASELGRAIKMLDSPSPSFPHRFPTTH